MSAENYCYCPIEECLILTFELSEQEMCALTEPVVITVCVLHRMGLAPSATGELIEVFTGVGTPIHGLQQRES